MSSENTPTSLTFHEVNVTRMPGIDPPGISLDDGFVPGVNVIHGPNAAGKTMLIRSMNTLLWPDQCAPANAFVRGNFSTDGDDWFIKVEGAQRTFQKDGAPHSGPPLPPAEQRDRYNLALHDLLQDSTTDRTFAELIVQELFGGYDVSAAAEELGFEEDHSYPGKTKQRAEEAMKQLNEAREKMADLESEEKRLSQLRKEREEAAEARIRIELLKQVLNVYDAREELEEVRRTLDEFPEVMEEITGREREQVEQLNQEIESLKEKRDQAEREIRKAKRKKEQLDYPYDRPVSDELREWKNQYENLKDLGNQIADLEDEREATLQKRREEQNELGEDADPEQLSQLRRPAYDELSGFAREAEEVRTNLEALEHLRSLLVPDGDGETDGENGDLPPVERLKRGCNVLENWLSHPPEDSEPALTLTWTHHVLQGLFSMLTIVAAVSIHPLLIILLLVPAIVYLINWYVADAQDGSMRESAQREFEQLDLHVQPEDWTDSSVRSVLQELYEERAERVTRRIKTEQWELRNDDYRDLRERMDDLKRKREDLAEQYGLSPDTDERTLYFLTNRLSRWKDAHADVRGIEEKLEQKQERFDRILSELNEEFQKWNLDEADGVSDVRSHLDDIERRIETYREAERTIERKSEMKSHSDSELPDLVDRRDRIYTRLDLEPGDDAALQKLLERREEYRELRSKLDEKNGIYKKEQRKLKEMSEYDPDLTERDRADVRREIDELERTASEHDEIQDQITKIKTKLEDARQEYEVEPAMARKERAFDDLRRQLETDYENMAGHVLARYVQNVNTARTMPAVFERARELLATVSTGRYELSVEQSDPPSFRVVDTLYGEGKSLDQLSSGTRIQVLLAIRLAFCQHGEEHVRLPLFMDETLANADDTRAHIIIESVLELAREGRQVFYFTAQGDEVAKWRSVANQRDEQLQVFNLQEYTDQELEGSVRIPELPEVHPEDEHVPAAEGTDHDTYGRKLDVPPLDPRDGVESVHLWYLIEDVGALAYFLRKGIHHWGPLKTLLEHGSEVAGDDSHRGAIRRARERAKATEAFVEQWRVGRNRPVQRPELRASGAVSDNFIDEVTELAEACDGDPEELVERLRAGEVSGFLTKKMDELEEFLKSEGYIDPADALEPDLIRAAMISAVDEEVLDEPEEEIDRLWSRIQERGSVS